MLRLAANGTGGNGQTEGMITVRPIGPGEWREWRDMRRAALADAPEAFSSTLVEWSGEGDTEERWRARLTTVERNLLADIDGRPAGMVSGTAPSEGTVELISMWVAPGGRGRGVGDALVGAVLQWAVGQGATRVVLDVREHNRHAMALYERHGFVNAGAAPAQAGSGPPCERRMVVELAGRRPAP